MTDPAPVPPPTPADAQAPFRPRRGRILPLILGSVAVVVCTIVAIGMGAAGEWQVGDQLALVGLGLGLAAFLGRYASIKAVPDGSGLTLLAEPASSGVPVWYLRGEPRFGGLIPDHMLPQLAARVGDSHVLTIADGSHAPMRTHHPEATTLAILHALAG